MMYFTKTIPLSLYIHIPWCIKKCPYCDFNSHALKLDLDEQNYVEVLIKDLEMDLPKIWGRRIISIFIGGGTPSLFSPDAINTLLTAIHTRLNFGPEIEITLEANPGTVEQQRFEGFKQAGVNRLSIGCQSFADEQLKNLGRIHGREEALKAVQAAREAGFDNFNLDLMFGLPQQTIAAALSDLQTAIDLQPTHISWYQLTLEPNTLFYKQPPPLPADETLWEMYCQGKALLEQNGFEQYEVSAYGKQFCTHNLNYWQFGDYLGIGAGAHGKITDVNAGTITRTLKHKHPKAYLNAAGNFIVEETQIAKQDVAFEFMLNAMRLNQAIPIPFFTERTGLVFNHIKKPVDEAIARGLLKIDKGCMVKTELGNRFLNDLVELFLG